MRMINVLVTVIGAVLLAVLGVLSLATAVYPPLMLNVGDAISGPVSYGLESLLGRSLALAVGVILLAGIFYLIWGNLRAARRERTIVLQTPLGEVFVSLPAVEDFARVLKGKIEGLRDIKGRVIYTRKGLNVSARITVLSDYNIVDVTQNVQDGIKNYIQNTLSINQDINPTVIVTKVISRDKPQPPRGLKTSPPGGSGLGPYPLR